jgi:hypothetical protein
LQENWDPHWIQIYNRKSTDELHNTTTSGIEVRYLNIYNLKNKSTSRMLINLKIYLNMQADQASMEANSENNNRTILSFSRDYDVSANMTT